MKKLTLVSLVLAAMALSACNKKPVDPVAAATGTKPAATAAAASAPKADEKPRLATYDPNLKPAEIVWDSPEKKKQWEARQAQLKAAGAAPAAAPASTAKR